MLDPFLPESLEDTQHLQGLLDATHQQFIARVREGRGERLTPGDEDVFDGRVWSGEQALVLGLVDSLASLRNRDISLTRLRGAARMIMRKYDIGGIVIQCIFYNFSRIYGRSINRPTK